MKQLRGALLVVFASLTSGLWAENQVPSHGPNPSPQSGETVKMITEAWPPWFVDRGKNGTGGIFDEITRELCRRAGIQYEIKFYPWKRCLNMMESGQADVLLMLEKDSGRERYMLYSESILKDENLVYFRVGASRQEWESWKDLKEFTIGMTNGYTFGDEFEMAKKKYGLRFDFAVTDLQTILKLVGGRFDVAIVNRTVAQELFRVRPDMARQVKAAKKPVSSALFYIAFSRKSINQGLLPRMNEAIRTMKADGTIDRLINEGLGDRPAK